MAKGRRRVLVVFNVAQGQPLKHSTKIVCDIYLNNNNIDTVREEYHNHLFRLSSIIIIYCIIRTHTYIYAYIHHIRWQLLLRMMLINR